MKSMAFLLLAVISLAAGLGCKKDSGVVRVRVTKYTTCPRVGPIIPAVGVQVSLEKIHTSNAVYLTTAGAGEAVFMSVEAGEYAVVSYTEDSCHQSATQVVSLGTGDDVTVNLLLQ